MNDDELLRNVLNNKFSFFILHPFPPPADYVVVIAAAM